MAPAQTSGRAVFACSTRRPTASGRSPCHTRFIMPQKTAQKSPGRLNLKQGQQIWVWAWAAQRVPAQLLGADLAGREHLSGASGFLLVAYASWTVSPQFESVSAETEARMATAGFRWAALAVLLHCCAAAYVPVTTKSPVAAPPQLIVFTCALGVELRNAVLCAAAAPSSHDGAAAR